MLLEDSVSLQAIDSPNRIQLSPLFFSVCVSSLSCNVLSNLRIQRLASVTIYTSLLRYELMVQLTLRKKKNVGKRNE